MGGGPWLLVNASPDLRAQIESFAALYPAGKNARGTPIRDVLLTNADFDHVLGLYLLREHPHPMRIHCTPGVRETLCGALRMETLLSRYCGIEWNELPETAVPFGSPEVDNPFTLRAIPLSSSPPRYAQENDSADGQSVALEFIDKRSGTRLVIAPDVAEITPGLQQALEAADMVLFDGTFWSDGELQRIEPTARTASQMGHLPISGGSLDVLQKLRARTRVYLHINNTNPILAADSDERAEVVAAGMIVGEDGMEFEV